MIGAIISRVLLCSGLRQRCGSISLRQRGLTERRAAELTQFFDQHFQLGALIRFEVGRQRIDLALVGAP